MKAVETKTMIIEVATTLFQKKGYLGVGVNEILIACQISKGAFYHHFPDGKESLLIACLQALHETITQDIEAAFKQYTTTEESVNAIIGKLIQMFEQDIAVTSFTFSSIASEMSSLSPPVRQAYARLYQSIQELYRDKLMSEGLGLDQAHSIALMITASIEGGILLCLAEYSPQPLKSIANSLQSMLQTNKGDRYGNTHTS